MRSLRQRTSGWRCWAWRRWARQPMRQRRPPASRFWPRLAAGPTWHGMSFLSRAASHSVGRTWCATKFWTKGRTAPIDSPWRPDGARNQQARTGSRGLDCLAHTGAGLERALPGSPLDPALGPLGMVCRRFAAAHRGGWLAGPCPGAARAQSSPLAPVATTPAFTAPSDAQDAAGNLRRFERILLPHDEIPQLVQDLLQWAQDEGLSIERGDYQADADSEGGFMRYRMSLPVRGKSTAVHRLILKALSAQKNLTLESLQFKREQVSSEVIEARIQWLAMTQMPPSWTAAGAAQPVR